MVMAAEPVSVVPVTSESGLRAAFAIRTAVFVDEQGVDPTLEMDVHDDDPAVVHVLARVADDPVGTGRIRRVETTTAKVERVAVLPAYRGRGVGQEIMRALESLVPEGVTDLVLHSQHTVEGFYQTLGYRRDSEVFVEAGIDHVRMRRSLTDP